MRCYAWMRHLKEGRDCVSARGPCGSVSLAAPNEWKEGPMSSDLSSLQEMDSFCLFCLDENQLNC